MGKVKQVVKHRMDPRVTKNVVVVRPVVAPVEKKEEKEVVEQVETKNKRKKVKDMDEKKMNVAEEIAQKLLDSDNVKIVKKDRGLIERTESSKIILTEDNRQVLND